MSDGSLRPLCKAIVLVEERPQYGTIVYAPANDLARALADLLGKKTLPSNAIAQLKRMGLTVQTTGSAPRRL